MAISTFCKTDAIISAEELVAYVDENIDVCDDDSLLSAAEKLQGLANNKEALIEILNRDLLRYDIATGASYSQSSTVLGTGKKEPFLIRANMWPPASTGTVRTIEEALFSYELPHDHNFSFLTANYFGPGYITDIWECLNPSAVQGYEGEQVQLKFSERTRLEPGKQMLFRRQRDIHTQHPPDEYSVSLNILVVSNQDRLSDQFEYDVQNNLIAGFPSATMSSKRAFLMDLAGYLGDEKTSDILMRIAEQHPCQRTRAAALSSALKICPASANSLKPILKNDKSEFIQKIIRQVV